MILANRYFLPFHTVFYFKNPQHPDGNRANTEEKAQPLSSNYTVGWAKSKRLEYIYLFPLLSCGQKKPCTTTGIHFWRTPTICQNAKWRQKSPIKEELGPDRRYWRTPACTFVSSWQSNYLHQLRSKCQRSVEALIYEKFTHEASALFLQKRVRTFANNASSNAALPHPRSFTITDPTLARLACEILLLEITDFWSFPCLPRPLSVLRDRKLDTALPGRASHPWWLLGLEPHSRRLYRTRPYGKSVELYAHMCRMEMFKAPTCVTHA